MRARITAIENPATSLAGSLVECMRANVLVGDWMPEVTVEGCGCDTLPVLAAKLAVAGCIDGEGSVVLRNDISGTEIVVAVDGGDCKMMR